MSETKPGAAANLLFGYRGGIEPAKYWIGMAANVAMIIGLLLAAAFFMDPRGGMGLFVPVTIILLVLVPWVHSAVTIKRLRDAGRSPISYLIYGGGPFLWLFLTIEFVEYLGFVILAVFLLFIAIPGFLPSRIRPDSGEPGAITVFFRKIDSALQSWLPSPK